MNDNPRMPPRRFIAGAVCPGCGQMDKLKAWVIDEIQHRECVACGFADRMSMNSPQGIPTRVDPADQSAPIKEPAPKQAEQTMQFFPRPPKQP